IQDSAEGALGTLRLRGSSDGGSWGPTFPIKLQRELEIRSPCYYAQSHLVLICGPGWLGLLRPGGMLCGTSNGSVIPRAGAQPSASRADFSAGPWPSIRCYADWRNGSKMPTLSTEASARAALATGSSSSQSTIILWPG